jgi:hypothetical protein
MNIQKERVYDVFVDLFGCNMIERVDMIERKNDAGEEYKRAFVHFKSWPRTEQATEVRLKLLNGVEVKIMYDQPWFWRISASRVPRPEDVRRREVRPFIVIDEDDSKDTRRSPYQPRQQHTLNPCDHRDERRQHQPRRQEQRHQERSSYTRRPSIHITPTKTAPEIADWIEKSKHVPGAPLKFKKPRLVISNDGGDAGADDMAAAKEKQTTVVNNNGHKLSFEEASYDVEAVRRVAHTPCTSPVANSSSRSSSGESK